MKPLSVIPDILKNFEKSTPRERAFAYWVNDKWEYLSSKEFSDGVKKLTAALLELGLQKGDHVGIYAPSSPRWLMIDLATASAGGVTVPFFYNLSEEHFVFEVDQTKPRFLFVGEDKNWERVKKHADHFEKIIKIDDKATFPSDLTVGGLLEREPDILAYENAISKVKSDDLAAIIFTSGSTGMPKGAKLSHKNLVAIVHEDVFISDPKSDRFLSFLPLAHIFTKQLNLITIARGVQSFYINDEKKIGDAVKEVKPTFIITVPKLLEKIYAKMQAKVEESSLLKRVIGKLAFKAAFNGMKIFKLIFDPLVYKKLRAALGGKLRLVICGGAALDPNLHKFFLYIGIPVYQGWGMTETSTMTVNRLNANKIGTVGPAFGDTEFKIGADGEVLVKGSTVMKGYYNDEILTKNSFDEEGWFRTGDRGKIGKDNHLIIEGRLNETFKLTTGEFVSPSPIEQRLSQSPLIESAMCVGESQPYVTCLLFPDWLYVHILREKHVTDGLTNYEFLMSDFIKNEVEKLISNVNATLDSWETIRKWRLVAGVPSVDSGELTPTLKIRRNVILQNYKKLINDMYIEEQEER